MEEKYFNRRMNQDMYGGFHPEDMRYELTKKRNEEKLGKSLAENFNRLNARIIQEDSQRLSSFAEFGIPDKGYPVK